WPRMETAEAPALGGPEAAGLCARFDPDRSEGRPPSVGAVAVGGAPVRVHYCHPSLAALAGRLAAAAERSYRYEVGELGLAAPIADGDRGGGPELDIYLADLGRAGRAQAEDEDVPPEAPVAPGYVAIDYRTPEAHDFAA